MALRPVPMKRVDMVILAKDVRRVTTALGRLGVLHLVAMRPEEATAPLLPARPSGDLDRCRALATRLTALREKIGLATLPEAAEETHEPLAAVEAKISALESEAEKILAARAALENQAEEIQEELLRLDLLGIFNVPLARIVESPFLHFAIGTIRASDLARLAEAARDNIILLEQPRLHGAAATDRDRRRLIAITSRKGRFALETLLKEHRFAPDDLAAAPKGTPAAIVAGLQERLEQIRQEHRKLRSALDDFARRAAPTIAALERRLHLEQALIEAEMNFGHTSSTCVISGWLPADYVATVSERLLQETGGRLVLQVREPEESGTALEEVPVLMRPHPLLRPFGLLVRGFGLPRYNEVEPTPLVALSFLLMYGLMFGDVGQGAVLALIGLLVRYRSREAEMRDLGFVIAAAGLASALAGFLYGSVFGKDILPALWVRPLDERNPASVIWVLEIPIALGALLISAGVILNIINCFRRGDYLTGTLDRFGVVGIIFYWGALGLGLRYVILGPGAPTLRHLALLVFLPLAILFFREPLLHLLARRRHGEGGLTMILHGGIGVLETVSTYLANTVSFARVGAFALAHAGLCLAVFSLEEAVRDLPIGLLWSALVLVLGNALVIALEGMIVFVQCMRLEYYEFFGKFLEGAGTRYRPFRIS